MPKSAKRMFDRWRLDELLDEFPGLSLGPVTNGHIRLAGPLTFSRVASGLERIDDTYEVEITLTEEFPHVVPLVKETGGRIPKSYHTNPDGRLCLGSPTRLALRLQRNPTLLCFVSEVVVPYLYGFSFHEKHGHLPFGELDHGKKGIRSDFAELFGVKSEESAINLVELAAMKKRHANKHPCPCGSGRRLGRCHNHRVNALRQQLGRKWFREQYAWLAEA